MEPLEQLQCKSDLGQIVSMKEASVAHRPASSKHSGLFDCLDFSKIRSQHGKSKPTTEMDASLVGAPVFKTVRVALILSQVGSIPTHLRH